MIKYLNSCVYINYTWVKALCGRKKGCMKIGDKDNKGATHEMIPMHCPSIPRQEASLSFHPWPTHQNPTAFLLAEATKKFHIFSKHLQDHHMSTRNVIIEIRHYKQQHLIQNKMSGG